MPRYKFHVGDRVKVLRGDWKGREGIIHSINPGPTPFKVIGIDSVALDFRSVDLGGVDFHQRVKRPSKKAKAGR